MKYILFLTLPLYILDQVTKGLVLRFIHPDDPPQLIVPDFFALVNVTNDGAAFGSFKNNNAFFIVLSCVAFVFVFALLARRARSRDRLRDVSLALLLAGILGNLTARLQRRRLLYLHRSHLLYRSFAQEAERDGSSGVAAGVPRQQRLLLRVRHP